MSKSDKGQAKLQAQSVITSSLVGVAAQQLFYSTYSK